MLFLHVRRASEIGSILMPVFSLIPLDIFLAIQDLSTNLQVWRTAASAPPVLERPGINSPPTRKLGRLDVARIPLLLSWV